MNALHAAQSFGVVVPKKAFVFGHMVMLKIFHQDKVPFDMRHI